MGQREPLIPLFSSLRPLGVPQTRPESGHIHSLVLTRWDGEKQQYDRRSGRH